MANIKRIEGKNGVSFKITVTQGRDMNGRQIRHYMTWVPEKKMTERQMQKAVERVAADFERQIEMGFQLDNRQTFAEYAEYFLEQKAREGLKYRTIEIYRMLLLRINQAIGHLKLADIKPQHLNRFYANLAEEGIRNKPNRAIAKIDLAAVLKQKKVSRAFISERSGVAASTVGLAVRGETIMEDKARSICDVLGVDFNKTFTVIHGAKEPLASSTLVRHHALIHVILAQAEREMLIPFNPADKAIPPKATRKEVDTFQPEEIERIRDAADKEPINRKMLIHLFLITGCRRGEICGIKWEKIDFEKNTVKIDRALLYSPTRGVYEDSTKTRSTRTIRLPQETMQMLRQYRAWQNSMRLMQGDRWTETGYLFTTETGTPINPSSISPMFRWFEKRHNLPHIHPHKFRHTMASILYFSGADPVSISKRLGHAEVSTTQNIYSHLIEQADIQSAEMIAEAFLRRKKA